MITRKTRRGIVTLVLLTAISFWINRNQDKDTSELVTDLDPKLNYVLRDFELQFFNDSGQPTINMRAPVLRNNPNLQMGTIEHPVITVNHPGAEWNLTSDSATVTSDKEHVQLLGQVHVQKRESATGNWVELDTSDVLLEVTPQTASSDQAVSMFDGYNRLSGIGFDLDIKTNSFKLNKKVKATYALN